MNKLSTLIPMDQIEPGAVAQIEAALAQPFVERLAIMPDCHQGYDLPIGAVALCRGVISPSYVGYDIGCGMTMVITDNPPEAFGLDTEQGRREALERIIKAVPMGTGREHAIPTEGGVGPFFSTHMPTDLVQSVNDKAQRQFGTLGGGNHFIEVGVTQETNRVAITIHSGSRKPGHTIADWYMSESSYIDIESDLGRAYVADKAWACAFAYESRMAMARAVMGCLGIGSHQIYVVINEHHNDAWVEDGGMVIHRKGATPAHKDQLGVIPLNARDGVVITNGLGNEGFLCSASHGAGRRMGRKAAERTLDPTAFLESVSGITSNIDMDMIDEAPAAYKDGEAVIAAQNGVVVEVVEWTTPLIVAKGK